MKRISIVGQKFRGRDEYLTGINALTQAFLVREPDNRYDANAVQVWVDGAHVGYLPKTQNREIAQYLDKQYAPDILPLAMDEKITPETRKALTGVALMEVKFVRSPNSGYPQIEFDDEAIRNG